MALMVSMVSMVLIFSMVLMVLHFYGLLRT